MDYSNIRNDSDCLDQVLMIIFVILVILFIIYFCNINKNESMNNTYSDINEYLSNLNSYNNESFKKINDVVVNNNNLPNNKYYNESFKNINDDVQNNRYYNESFEKINDDVQNNRYYNESFENINDDVQNNRYYNESFEKINVDVPNNSNYNESLENIKDDVVINNVSNYIYDNEFVEKINDDVVNNLENISGFLNGDQPCNMDQSCNMDQQQKELVDDYKKKYFTMYRHQIECPKNCQLHNLDLSKCNLSDNNDCQGIFTKDYNNPDVFTLSHLALNRNNNRKCVTCTSNDDRQTVNMIITNLNVNEEEEVKINERRLNNRNKFADFNDYIDRNGVMETSVDKIAELRTSTTGTCGLNCYGKKVSDVYNNLLSTSYTEDKNKCVNGPVEGINDSNFNDSYATI